MSTEATLVWAVKNGIQIVVDVSKVILVLAAGFVFLGVVILSLCLLGTMLVDAVTFILEGVV
jgi:hypothetical protein